MRLKFSASSADFKAEGAKVIEDIKASVADSEGAVLSEDNYEGVRYQWEDSTTLVRMSVHDPVMPVNFESDKKGGTKMAAEKLLDLLKGYEFLDLSSLIKYIK